MDDLTLAEHAAVLREAHRESLLYQESGSQRFYEAEAAFNRWLDALVAQAEELEQGLHVAIKAAENWEQAASTAAEKRWQAERAAERAETTLAAYRSAMRSGESESEQLKALGDAVFARRENPEGDHGPGTTSYPDSSWSEARDA